MQKYQIYQDKKKEEDRLIFEIFGLLNKYHYYLPVPEKDIINCGKEDYAIERERMDIKQRLMTAAFQLKTKKNRNIAVRICKFTLEKQLRTKENLKTLKTQVYDVVNKELFEQYDKEILNTPENF